MNDAFRPRVTEREVRGVAVRARSLTVNEAIAHQARVRAKMSEGEVLAHLVLAVCTDAAGAALFASVEEVMQADSDAVAELAKLAMEANARGTDEPDPTK